MSIFTKAKECLKDTAYVGLKFASNILKFIGITMASIYTIASVGNMLNEHYKETKHPEKTEEIAKLKENYKPLGVWAGTGGGLTVLAFVTDKVTDKVAGKGKGK